MSATRARNDSRIYVTGNFTEYDGSPIAGVMRLFPDGTLDQSFVTDGSFGGFGDELDVVAAVSPAGTLYAYGGAPSVWSASLRAAQSIQALRSVGASTKVVPLIF